MLGQIFYNHPVYIYVYIYPGCPRMYLDRRYRTSWGAKIIQGSISGGAVFELASKVCAGGFLFSDRDSAWWISTLWTAYPTEMDVLLSRCMGKHSQQHDSRSIKRSLGCIRKWQNMDPLDTRLKIPDANPTNTHIRRGYVACCKLKSRYQRKGAKHCKREISNIVYRRLLYIRFMPR